MSLYNMVFGVRASAPLILAVLKLEKDNFGRFRDAYFHRGQDKRITMHVYTRCGGGNRKDYEEVFEEMKAHPLFIDEWDDDYDCTYCTFEFRLPEGDTELAQIAEVFCNSNNSVPQESFKELIDRLESRTAQITGTTLAPN